MNKYINTYVKYRIIYFHNFNVASVLTEATNSKNNIIVPFQIFP